MISDDSNTFARTDYGPRRDDGGGLSPDIPVDSVHSLRTAKIIGGELCPSLVKFQGSKFSVWRKD